MDLEGKAVLVIGLGRTGVATARFLLEKGARVLAAEEKPLAELGDTIDPLRGVPDLELSLIHI